MNRSIRLGLAVALLTAVAPAGAKDSDNRKAPAVLAEGDRVVPGGRLVQANLHQREIATSIYVDPIVSYSGSGYYNPYYGGWLFGSWLYDIDRERIDVTAERLKARTETAAEPVRKALYDFDVQSLMLSTTKAALAKVEWFQPRDYAVSSDAFGRSRIDFLAQNGAPQIAFVKYLYDLSPDFTQIRVLVEVTIERKPAKPVPGGNLTDIIYRQHVLSIVKLRAPAYELKGNAKSWSADNGRLAKAALTTAFAQFETLIPYMLGLKQTDVATFADKKSPKAFAGGYYGTLISRSPTEPDDMLIWYKGLVHVQPIG